MQNYNNPRYQDTVYNDRGGMGNAIPNKPAFKCPATHTVRYHGAANVMGRLLTVAKGQP